MTSCAGTCCAGSRARAVVLHVSGGDRASRREAHPPTHLSMPSGCRVSSSDSTTIGGRLQAQHGTAWHVSTAQCNSSSTHPILPAVYPEHSEPDAHNTPAAAAAVAHPAALRSLKISSIACEQHRQHNTTHIYCLYPVCVRRVSWGQGVLFIRA